MTRNTDTVIAVLVAAATTTSRVSAHEDWPGVWSHGGHGGRDDGHSNHRWDNRFEEHHDEGDDDEGRGFYGIRHEKSYRGYGDVDEGEHYRGDGESQEFHGHGGDNKDAPGARYGGGHNGGHRDGRDREGNGDDWSEGRDGRGEGNRYGEGRSKKRYDWGDDGIGRHSGWGDDGHKRHVGWGGDDNKNPSDWGIDGDKNHSGWEDDNDDAEGNQGTKSHGRGGKNQDHGKHGRSKARGNHDDKDNKDHGRKTPTQAHGNSRGDSYGNVYSPRKNDGVPMAGLTEKTHVAQTLRSNTETFVADGIAWIRSLVGQDAASTLLVDTSFSLKKSQGTNLDRAACDGGALSKLFPVLRKFIEHSQDVNLLDEDVKKIAWTPATACSSDGDAVQFEGGIYASFHLSCAEQLLLNVSIASSGSVPTVQGQQAKDSDILINVDVLDGTILATDALGSIMGTVKNRHFPENAPDILKNWTSIVHECGQRKQLAVDGVVGGGWTEYTTGKAADVISQTAVVGYTEYFRLSFPTQGATSIPTSENPTPEPDASSNETASSSFDDDTIVFDSSTGTLPGTVRGSVQLSDTAAIASTAYVQCGVQCGQLSTAHTSCSGRAVLAQLNSFYRLSAASRPMGDHAATFAPIVALALVAFACVAFMLTTLRRRNGYRALSVQNQA